MCSLSVRHHHWVSFYHIPHPYQECILLAWVSLFSYQTCSQPFDVLSSPKRECMKEAAKGRGYVRKKATAYVCSIASTPSCANGATTIGATASFFLSKRAV